MLFGKKDRCQLIVGKLISPIPQLGDGPFTVSCFVYLEGEKAGNPKWRDINERSRFRLELQLQELDDKIEHGDASSQRDLLYSPVDGLKGLTAVSGLGSKVTESGGLRFDLDQLHILPEIDKGTFRTHAKLSRARSKFLHGPECEMLAEADSEPFTRGDMTKHRLPDGWEIFHGCEGFR